MAELKINSRKYFGCCHCRQLHRIEVYTNGTMKIMTMTQSNSLLKDLPLPSRVIKGLEAIGICDLASFLNSMGTLESLLRIQGFGSDAAGKVNEVLHDLGLPELE